MQAACMLKLKTKVVLPPTGTRRKVQGSESHLPGGFRGQRKCCLVWLRA